MGKKCKIDPEFKALIPPLSAEEYGALEASIQSQGCLHAVVTWKGLLIDGHHRVEICRKLGKPFNIREMQFADREQVFLWMLNHQLARRNLTDYQRGVLALKQKELIASRGKQGARTDLLENSPNSSSLNTREEVAKAAGISSNTLAKVEKVEQKATPEVQQAVRDGAISINAAAKLADLPQQEQKEAAALGVGALKAKAKQSTTNPKPAVDVKQSSEQKLMEALKAENDALKGEVAQLKESLSKAEHEIGRLSTMLVIGEENNDDLRPSVATLQTA